MKYMRMAPGALSKVTIPRFNGGLNVYDMPARVADNQLTDCDNLWWYRGALRTRPGLTYDEGKVTAVYTHRQVVDERTVLGYKFYTETEGTDVLFGAAKLSSDNGFSQFAQGFTHTVNADKAQIGDLTALGIRARKNDGFGWYHLLSNGEIIRQKNSANGAAWVAAEPYVPTVMINGVGDQCEADAKASAYEDYNLLTRAFQCHFTTDGTSTTWKLPEGTLSTDLQGETVESETGGTVAIIELDVAGAGGVETKTVTLTKPERGEIEKKIDLTAAQAGTAGEEDVELRISINCTTGVVATQLWTKTGSSAAGGQSKIPSGLPFVVSNNLRITAWRGREHEKDRLTICKMTRGTWYGGDRSGIAGGTRFFVCGNPDEPDLLCWSGIEHPLYFPEHNRVRVGDTHSAITALGKQSSLLVIYKDHEIYGMQYLSSDSEDYDFATSGGVAVTSYMATFTLTPINASVGCDCPDTVRLVNNRLIWACSDGSVYMLTATNQYSERNVRMISRNVRRLLADCCKNALRAAQATELEGYYLIVVGCRVFLMNTQTSAFASFSYYDDEDAAAKAIPWYAWTLPQHLTYTAVVCDGDTATLAVTDTAKSLGTVATLKTDEKTDDDNPIHCRLATKLWDFGIPDHKKSVEALYIGLRCEDLPRLHITYVTDRGCHIDPYRMENNGVDGVGYCPIRRLTPNVRMVQTFGMKVDSDAAMEMDGVAVKVRKQGVIR